MGRVKEMMYRGDDASGHQRDDAKPHLLDTPVISLVAQATGGGAVRRAIASLAGAFWGGGSYWRDCHSADALSPSLLKRLLKVEGVQQNDSLADG